VRVALLHPTYWPEVRRGSERFLHDLATGLAQRGHDVHVVTSHPGRPSTTVEDGVEVTRVWRPPSGRLRRRGLEDHLTHLPLAARALRRVGPDVVHAVYPTDGLVAARSGKPAVLSYMGLPNRAYLASRRSRAQITRKAAFGVRATVALSEAAANALDRELGIDARVIAPGVDLQVFGPDPSTCTDDEAPPGEPCRSGGQVQLRASEPTVVCPSAANEPRKRVPLLAKACRRVGARLILSEPAAGGPGIEGRDLDDCETLVAAYREAWVCALPSTSEAFGLTLVEALACGTPVVATNAGGMAEIVNDDRIGRLFDAPEELPRALEEALRLDDRQACRARAEDFGVDKTVDAYEALYAEIAS
jgi:glycosyltransferase involved in cell wall biosynthesis